MFTKLYLLLSHYLLELFLASLNFIPYIDAAIAHSMHSINQHRWFLIIDNLLISMLIILDVSSHDISIDKVETSIYFVKYILFIFIECFEHFIRVSNRCVIDFDKLHYEKATSLVLFLNIICWCPVIR